MSAQETASIDAYEAFINTTLRPRLVDLLRVKQDLADELGGYRKLNSAVAEMQRCPSFSPFESLVHIGQGCHVQASIEPPHDKVYVHIGIGFHIEVTLVEALEISTSREDIICRKIAFTQADIDIVVADIENALLMIQQLRDLEN